MIFETRNLNDAVVVSIPTKTLDARNSTEFKTDIAEILDANKKIILDMGNLTFVDSSGLGAILSCLRRTGANRGQLRLCRMQKPVMMLFELVRVHNIFTILETPEDAAMAFDI